MAFRFRAQAALDLRSRELQDAQRELAKRQGDRDAAQRKVVQAGDALTEARAKASEAQRTLTDCTALQWYQFWIVRLDHERKAHAATLAARDEAVTQARAACLQAQQKRDSLERFRDKARLAYEAAESARERKLFDELATRRYAVTRQSVVQSDS
jgi:flagellar export protein FliJ